MNWGAAAKYDFDNPQKWVTIPDVPLLDEHEMTNEEGEPVAYVGKEVLEEIAQNNNRKVYETGDPATLILGHTSDDPRAPEKPAQGFVVNYRVKPFKRRADGQIIYAIRGDYKLRPNKAHLVEEYPRRSVELWWNKKDIDPIAMLGGSSPERDLGVVLRQSRLNHVSMGVGNVASSGIRTTRSDSDNSNHEGQVIRFSSHRNYSIETYYIDDNKPTHKYAERRNSKNGKVHKVMHEFKNGELHSGSKHGPKVTSHKQAIAIAIDESKKGKPSKYAEGEDDDDNDDEDQYSPEDLERMNSAEKKRAKEIADKQAKEMSDKKYVDDRRERRKLPPFHNSRNSNMSSKYGRGEYIPKERIPHKYSEYEQDDGTVDEENPSRYGAGNEHDYDGGEESIPDEDEHDEMGGEDINDDPVLAKVFQSKQWKEMSSGIDQIKGMLQNLMGEEQEMGGAGGPEGGEEMPPPATDLGGGQPEEEGEPEEEEPDEDQRSMHGEKPVKMDAGMTHSTGMPGPSSGYIPNFPKGNKNHHPSHQMSRGNKMPTRMQKKEDKRDRIIQDLRIQLSRMKAEADINQLESEGVMFGNTPEVSDKIKYQRLEELTLAYLHDEDSGDEGQPDTYVKDKIEEMRMCYARRRPDLTKRSAPNVASVARYSRTQTDIAGQQPSEEVDDDFEDRLGSHGSFEAINEFANIQASGKSRQEAIKYCRKKYGIR
jgi:hypothetical protein